MIFTHDAGVDRFRRMLTIDISTTNGPLTQVLQSETAWFPLFSKFATSETSIRKNKDSFLWHFFKRSTGISDILLRSVLIDWPSQFSFSFFMSFILLIIIIPIIIICYICLLYYSLFFMSFWSYFFKFKSSLLPPLETFEKKMVDTFCLCKSASAKKLSTTRRTEETFVYTFCKMFTCSYSQARICSTEFLSKSWRKPSTGKKVSKIKIKYENSQPYGKMNFNSLAELDDGNGFSYDAE